MQEKVQQWLDEKIAEERKALEQEKDDLALSLGLYDDSVPVKYFADYNQKELTKEQYEQEKKYGYAVSKVCAPLKLTDEEYKEIKKHLPNKQPSKDTTIQTLLEKIESHTGVVSTILIISIIISVIVGIVIGLS